MSVFGPVIVWFHLPGAFLESELSELAIVSKSWFHVISLLKSRDTLTSSKGTSFSFTKQLHRTYSVPDIVINISYILAHLVLKTNFKAVTIIIPIL